MFEIEKELKGLPDKPGVYIMKDSSDNIIYVGKAKILKNRVRQYFQSSANQNLKTARMTSQIKSFECIITSTEVEALILECNLIKTHKPKYNVLLKDDKQYPYIKVTINEQFPQVFLTRRVKKDKAKYYGPYTDITAVKETLEIIKKHFKIRRCSKKLLKDVDKQRPCLNYHIGQCNAPCNNLISKEDYNLTILKILNLLDGKYEELISELTVEMGKASESLDFEKAAGLRDAIQSIKTVSKKQVITTVDLIDQDIIAFAKSFDEALIQVFFVRGGKIIGREHFLIDGIEYLTNESIITEFVKRFYSKTTTVPKEIIVQWELDDKETIINWLSNIRGNKVNIIIPKKGEKLKLLNLVLKNAELSFFQISEQSKSIELRTKSSINQIREALSLDAEIHRIEAYDISHTQGVDSVGVMVVFEDGLAKKKDYRKFKIKTVEGSNDFASMNEVISRRFIRHLKEVNDTGENKQQKFAELPDLIFMDGGKVQVAAAERALYDLGIIIPVCGMVKDDFHKTRGLFYLGKEIELARSSEGFKFICRVQEEVHRFAIEYHRKLRSKSQIQSSLDEICGIGINRRNSLIKHFGSIKKIKQATIEELLQVQNMNKKSAQAVYDYFH